MKLFINSTLRGGGGGGELFAVLQPESFSYIKTAAQFVHVPM
jgi:hypothetical protein